MEKLPPLLGIETIDEICCRPNFKNDIHQLKIFWIKVQGFELSKIPCPPARIKDLLKKNFFHRTKNLLPFDPMYEKAEENGFYQQK